MDGLADGSLATGPWNRSRGQEKKERKKSFLLPNEPAAMLDWEKTHASSSWGSNRRVHE